MMARPTEISAVSQVLMEPADDVRDVAKACIDALDEARVDRRDFMVLVQLGRLVQAYGPYATYHQAEKAITGQKIRALGGSRLVIVPVMHPKAHARTIEETDQPSYTEAAARSWEISRAGGQPAKTHSRRNRRRAS